ncbi:hypothetical protein EHS25_002415 [Saitozyma podzolica]|uniref:DUF6534 domain-containing protein n=1 Tax=Saitozyma podzolica TaxID=1890683 RepID=A0A427YE22_9TREE|nr:hypothetical protein EHS25_002415 [Saitozyma podzolica]
MSTNATEAAIAAEAAAKIALTAKPGISFGSYILGMWLDAIMGGIMITQLITYFSHSRNERWLIRIIVYWITVISTAFTVFIVVMNFHFFVYGFGSYLPFESVDWIGWPPLMDSFISTGVQAFYVDRAYRLNGKNKGLLIVLIALLVASFGAAIGTKIKFGLLDAESDAAQIDPFVWTWLGTCMAADILITTAVAYGLHKSRTGWSSTDALVQRLILLSAETQLPPALVTLGFLVEFCIDPPSSLGVFFECFQSKVYCIGLLYVLNHRFHLQRGDDFAGTTHERRGGKSNTFALGSAALQQATVNVTTDTYVETFQMQPERFRINRSNTTDKEDLDSEHDSNHHLDKDSIQIDYSSSRTGLTDASHQV